MKFAVVVFPGSNSDDDAFHAASACSASRPTLVWHKDTSLGDADAVILPGGFAHGDYLRTGAIARFSPIMPAVSAVRRAGRAGAGHLQRLPGAARGRTAARRDGSQPLPQVRVAIVPVRVEATDTPFTLACSAGQVLRMPIAHGEGNYFAEPERWRRSKRNRQVVFRYVDADGRGAEAGNPTVGGTTSPASATRPQRRRPDAASRTRVRAVGSAAPTAACVLRVGGQGLRRRGVAAAVCAPLAAVARA